MWPLVFRRSAEPTLSLDGYRLMFELFPGTTMSLRKTARVEKRKGGITSNKAPRAELVGMLVFSVH